MSQSRGQRNGWMLPWVCRGFPWVSNGFAWGKAFCSRESCWQWRLHRLWGWWIQHLSPRNRCRRSRPLARQPEGPEYGPSFIGYSISAHMPPCTQATPCCRLLCITPGKARNPFREWSRAPQCQQPTKRESLNGLCLPSGLGRGHHDHGQAEIGHALFRLCRCRLCCVDEVVVGHQIVGIVPSSIGCVPWQGRH